MMNIFMGTCTHIHARTHACTHLHAHTMYTYIHTYTDAFLHTQMYTNTGIVIFGYVTSEVSLIFNVILLFYKM